jgi:hypothetical protein
MNACQSTTPHQAIINCGSRSGFAHDRHLRGILHQVIAVAHRCTFLCASYTESPRTAGVRADDHAGGQRPWLRLPAGHGRNGFLHPCLQEGHPGDGGVPGAVASSLHAASLLPGDATCSAWRAGQCLLPCSCALPTCAPSSVKAELSCPWPCHVDTGCCGSQACNVLMQGGIVGWTADAAAVADALAQ